MNDEQNPNTPQEQPLAQPAVQPVASSPVTPQPTRITDITRVQPQPVAPIAPTSVPTPEPTITPASTEPSIQPQPSAVESEVPAELAGLQQQAEQSASLAETLKTILWGFINWVAAPLLIVFILHNFVFQAYHVDGSSMTPTLHTADYMIVSKVENSLAKLLGKPYIPRRHQVVVFAYPKDPSLIFIKRVTALPGERVVVKNGTITIYNSEHPDGFSPDDGSFERAASYTEGDVDEIVPEGSIFVVGDNRLPSGSFDSREWGMLPSEDIIGNAVIRLLPLDGFRFFSKTWQVGW